MDKKDIEIVKLGIDTFDEAMAPLFEAHRERVIGQLAVYNEDSITWDRAENKANRRLIGDFVDNLPFKVCHQRDSGVDATILRVPDAPTAHFAQAAVLWVAGYDQIPQSAGYYYDPKVVVGRKSASQSDRVQLLTARVETGQLEVYEVSNLIQQAADANLHASAYNHQQLSRLHDRSTGSFNICVGDDRSIVLHTNPLRTQLARSRQMRTDFSNYGVDRREFNNQDLHPIFRARTVSSPELFTDDVIREYDVAHHISYLASLFGKTEELTALVDAAVVQSESRL